MVKDELWVRSGLSSYGWIFMCVIGHLVMFLNLDAPGGLNELIHYFYILLDTINDQVQGVDNAYSVYICDLFFVPNHH